MDINKAFRFPMEDADWLKKTGIAAVMTLFSFLVIPGLILGGYCIKIVRQVMDGQQDGLPEWDDWGGLIKDGFFVALASFIYTLPFIILMFLGLFVGGGMASLSGDSDIMGLILGGGGLLLLCVSFLFIIALLFLMPAIVIQYAREGNFGATLRFSEVLGITRSNLANIAITFGVGFVVGLVSGVLGSIPVLGWIVIAIVGAYASFVIYHLYGQIGVNVLANKAGGTL